MAKSINSDELYARIRDGLDSFLVKLKDTLTSQVFSSQIPLLGDNLKDANNNVLKLLADIKTKINNSLDELKTQFPDPKPDDIRKALDAALEKVLPEKTYTVTVPNPNTFSFVLNLKPGTDNSFSTSIAKDIGLANLGLTLNGQAKIELGYEINLTFGLDEETKDFYVNKLFSI